MNEESVLSFGRIIKLDNNTFEVIIDPNIEMDVPMMNEYHNYFRENVRNDFVVLVNQKNAYSYKMEVQQEIGHMPNVIAFAILVYSEVNEISTRFIMNLPSNKSWNAKIFYDRGEALEWLRQEHSRL